MKAGFLAAVLSAGLCGCQPVALPRPLADLAAVTTEGRDTRDIAVSAATGRDCSIVRWSIGKSYCKPIEPPPRPPQYCTRSLARVDCWDRPDPFGYYQRPIADGPWQLSPEQERSRATPWLFR